MKKGFKVGPYELGRELGRGATGTVYEGVDHLNELTVAIKVIKHSQSSKRALLHEIEVVPPTLFDLKVFNESQRRL